ncbi:MAG: hypothetical protein JO139_11470 [Alphaproteobacteria bacterium]|nr:hypothetical protein [Alphaproteobacteria bacterium]
MAQSGTTVPAIRYLRVRRTPLVYNFRLLVLAVAFVLSYVRCRYTTRQARLL